MARPTEKFLDAIKPNRTWRGPTPDIADLHAYFTRIPEGDLSLSCWEFEPGEYQEVVRTGKVYLCVYGMHPPVFVSSAREVGELLSVPPADSPSVLAARVNESRDRELKEQIRMLKSERARFAELARSLGANIPDETLRAFRDSANETTPTASGETDPEVT